MLVAMSRFNGETQGRIQEIRMQIVRALEEDSSLTWTFEKPKLRIGGGSWPRTLTVHNQGLEYGRPDRSTELFRWQDIDELGFYAGQGYSGSGAYTWIDARKPGGGKGRAFLYGIDSQILLAAVKFIHECKVGRYIYPRLAPRPTGMGGKALGAVAGDWLDAFGRERVPEGVPPQIVVRRWQS